jgi:carboxyl-terminal processing protease
MTRCFYRGRLYVALLAVAASLFLVHSPAPADPKFAKQDGEIAQVVCEFLEKVHLNRPEIGDEVSRRLFRHFLKGLDPSKVYFLKSDIDEFKKSETELDDQIHEGNLKFAAEVFDRFVQRVEERQKLIEELVNAKHDFEAKEELDTDYDAQDWPKNDDEVRERWRKRIKFDLLMQRLGDKPVGEEEAKKKVLSRYQSVFKRYKQLDNADKLEIYLTDLTTSIDPHSTYMSPSTYEDFEISMRLNLEGIGAVLRSENGQTVVVEIMPGGAAAKDGRLKPNDKIVAVAQGDGKFVDAVDMKLQDVVKMIRGKRGTKVELKVIPVGKIESAVYELTREKVDLSSQAARGDIVEDGKKDDGKPYRIGVIDLPSFYAEPGHGKDGGKSATEDVRRILKDFESKKVDGVVLDLRRNGGGSLDEALSLTGLFIDKGPVVQVKDWKANIEQLPDPEAGIVYPGPLVVLTSRFSASASEILAGALQDYGRALIVGDSSTYGKGTVQILIDMGKQLGKRPAPKIGALKLTIKQFYRPNGDSTQVRGVVSDVVLPTLTEQLAGGEKEQDFALAFDKVKAAPHDELGLVTPELKAALQKRSAERVKASNDFTKLAKDIELFKERKARKKVPLNEKELKAQLSKDDADKLDDKVKDATPPDTPSSEAYKFKRNYMNNEVLQVMEDFIQGKKLVASR